MPPRLRKAVKRIAVAIGRPDSRIIAGSHAASR